MKKQVEKAGRKMEMERMKELFKEQYAQSVESMRVEPDRDYRWHFYGKACALLDFASKLGLISIVEHMDLVDELNHVREEDFLYRMSLLEKEEEKLPFEEVPEEEQETFEIEDLPFPEVMEKSPEKSEAEKMQKLLKKQYDLYVDVIREERDKDMCRTYHGKVSGMLDFAMELGIIDFAESFCMYNDMNKIADESFSRCEDPLETLRNAIKSGEYIDADIALAKVEDQYNLMKFNFGHPGCSDETDLHFMHGYMRCAADIGVMSEDVAEEAIKEFTKLYEEKQRREHTGFKYDRKTCVLLFCKAFGFVPGRRAIGYEEADNKVCFSCGRGYWVYKIEIDQTGKVEASKNKCIKETRKLEKIYTKSYASVKELL